MKTAEEPLLPQEQYIVDVLLSCAEERSQEKNQSSSGDHFLPAPAGTLGVIQVVPVLLSTIDGISHLRIHLSKDLRPLSNRETAWKAVKEIQRRWPDSVPLLDPVENMGIKDAEFLNLIKVKYQFELGNCRRSDLSVENPTFK